MENKTGLVKCPFRVLNETWAPILLAQVSCCPVNLCNWHSLLTCPVRKQPSCLTLPMAVGTEHTLGLLFVRRISAAQSPALGGSIVKGSGSFWDAAYILPVPSVPWAL